MNRAGDVAQPGDIVASSTTKSALSSFVWFTIEWIRSTSIHGLQACKSEMTAMLRWRSLVRPVSELQIVARGSLADVANVVVCLRSGAGRGTVTLQHVANGLIGNRKPEIGQGAHNPIIAPVPVLTSHANNQLLEI